MRERVGFRGVVLGEVRKIDARRGGDRTIYGGSHGSTRSISGIGRKKKDSSIGIPDITEGSKSGGGGRVSGH